MFGYFRAKIVRRNWFVVAACCVAPSGILAQTVPVEKLKPSNAVLREEFTSLSTRPVRELADGRVLISETAAASRLIVADFKSGVVEAIGRKGQGPGEYTFGLGLHALRHDSTLMVAGDSRWLLLAGAKIVETVSVSDPSRLHIRNADTLGNALMSNPGSALDDSTRVVLLPRRRGAAIASVSLGLAQEPGFPPKPLVSSSGMTRYVDAPWKSYEAAVLAPDGWIAVLRHAPYRIDWRSVDGEWILGSALPTGENTVTNREKIAFMKRAADRAGVAQKSPDTYSQWPRKIPPFLSSPITHVAPDGTLLVPRTPTAAHAGALYDVISRQGTLLRQLDIGTAERIVGFGKNVVFVVSIDGDGIQRISRHPWP